MGVTNSYISSVGPTIRFARGSAKSNLIVDDILEIFTPEGPMEWVIKDGQLIIKQKEAPDFGEFTPCQELNSFLESLA